MEVKEMTIEKFFYNSKAIRERLKNIGINTVGELCNCTRRELADKGIENLYIKEIVIALECSGVDLRKK